MNYLRFYTVELALVVILAGAVGYFGYLGYGLLTPAFVAEPFSGARALGYASTLVEFGDRVVGTEEGEEAGDWLVDELRSLGWDVVIQPFSIREGVRARNIIAVQGGGPSQGPVGILSAHYDLRAQADLDSGDRQRRIPSPGAHASASAAGLLLELARTLDVASAGHTLCLVFLDGEANGGLEEWQASLGSAYFVQRLDEDVARCQSPRFVISVDGVGGEGQQIFAQENGSPVLQNAIWQTAATLGYGEWFAPDRVGPDPYRRQYWLELDTPTVLMGEYEYPYRFTQRDTLDKLDAIGIERLGRTLRAWLGQGAQF